MSPRAPRARFCACSRSCASKRCRLACWSSSGEGLIEGRTNGGDVEGGSVPNSGSLARFPCLSRSLLSAGLVGGTRRFGCSSKGGGRRWDVGFNNGWDVWRGAWRFVWCGRGAGLFGTRSTLDLTIWWGGSSDSDDAALLKGLMPEE